MRLYENIFTRGVKSIYVYITDICGFSFVIFFHVILTYVYFIHTHTHFFSFFLAVPWHMELPGQRSIPNHSFDLWCCSGNTRSLTHCARLGIKPVSQGSRDTTDPFAPQWELLCVLSLWCVFYYVVCFHLFFFFNLRKVLLVIVTTRTVYLKLYTDNIIMTFFFSYLGFSYFVFLF